VGIKRNQMATEIGMAAPVIVMPRSNLESQEDFPKKQKPQRKAFALEVASLIARRILLAKNTR